jgi:hypothetical protein
MISGERFLAKSQLRVRPYGLVALLKLVTVQKAKNDR